MIRTLAMAAGLAVGASAANAAFVGATIVEGNSAAASAALGQAATVLNVYAAFDGMGDGQVNTVLSTSFVNINAVSGTFYQDALGGLLPPNSLFFPVVPTLQWDSYGTIGAATQQSPGGANISTEPGTAESATNYTGGWFNANPPSNAGAASVDLGDGTFGTLLFQLTLIGLGENGAVEISDLISGSMSVFTQGQGQAVENLVKFVPTPGALALFGVAGLAATRRRR